MKQAKFFILTTNNDGVSHIVSLSAQTDDELETECAEIESSIAIDAFFDRRNLRRIAKEIDNALSR